MWERPKEKIQSFLAGQTIIALTCRMPMKQLMRTWIVSMVVGVSVIGCKSETTTSSVNPGQVPADAEWVTTKDPAITANTRYAAGQLAESTGKIDAAIEQYQLALSVDKNHAPSLYRLGVLYAKQQQYEQSIDAWKRYIKATPTSAAGYANLGFTHELEGRNDLAESAYKQGIAIAPKDQPCRVNYGLMLARLGRINEAIAHLQAVLTPAEAHYNIASVYEQQGKTAQAKLEYTRALECDPTSFDAQQRLAALGD